MPGHIHDTSLYCNEIDRVLKYHQKKELKEKRANVQSRALLLTPREHEELAFNLEMNPGDLSQDVDELLALFQQKKQQLQARMDHFLKKKKRKHEREDPDMDSAQREKWQRKWQEYIDEAEITSREFLYRWKPLVVAKKRAAIYLEEWEQGLDEWLTKAESDVQTWKDLDTKQQIQSLQITVLYRHQTREEKRTFDVPNSMKVQDFIHLIQERMGISVHPSEELSLFSTRGPLKRGTRLNQYESNRIDQLTLYKIGPRDEREKEASKFLT